MKCPRCDSETWTIRCDLCLGDGRCELAVGWVFCRCCDGSGGHVDCECPAGKRLPCGATPARKVVDG